MNSPHGQLPDDILRDLGDVTVSQECLAWQFELLVWTMLDCLDEPRRQVGAAITADLSFGRLLNLCQNLSITVAGDGIDSTRVSDFVARASRLEQRRNTFVHSLWGRTSNGAIRFKTTAGRKGVKQAMEWLVDEPETALGPLPDEVAKISPRGLADLIRALCDEMGAFWFEANRDEWAEERDKHY